jgi:c-di-GMP-binding flagellar brake protein YcgR
MMETARAVEAERSKLLVFGERRRHARLKCAFSVAISGPDSQFRTLLRDLSLSGAALESPINQNPEIGQEVVLTIPFRKKKGHVIVRGTIVRITFNILGIVFKKRR